MRVITGKVKFSYANIWEPKSVNGGEAKYSVSLIIPKSDTKTIELIKKAIENVAEQGKGKWGGKIPVNLKTCLRDGDLDRPDDEAYANSYFINANSKDKPGIVDRDAKPILDQSCVYSGCYGRAAITFFCYNFNGNKGISCALQNLQKLSDGEPLGGRVKAENEFGDYDEIDDESFN